MWFFICTIRKAHNTKDIKIETPPMVKFSVQDFNFTLHCNGKTIVHLTFFIHTLQSKYYSEILKQIVDSSVHYNIFIQTEGN